MRTPRRRRSRLPIALATLVVAVTACGGDDDTSSTTAADPPGSTAAPSTATGAYPRTVASQLGDATIAAAPERVIALGWTDMDVAVALGVTPIAITAAPDVPGGMYPWLADALGGDVPELIDVYTAGIPIEQIAALDPDLILAVNQYVQDDYAALSALAPVVSYLEDPWGEEWRDHARQIARGLARESELEEVMAGVDDAVAQARASIPELDGLTFTFSAYRQDGFDLIDRPDVPVVEFMAELGMHLPEEIADPASVYSRTVSMENVELLDADVVVVWTADPDAMAADAVFRTLPAARDGRVVFIDDVLAQALNSPSALSIPYTLDVLLPDLVAAAAAVDG